MYDLHGTELNFVHGRIGRAITGFIGGGPLGAVGGFAAGGQPRGGGKRFTPQQVSGAATHLAEGHSIATPGHGWLTPELVALAQASLPGRFLSAPKSAGCAFPGQKRDTVTGECGFFLGVQAGPDTGGEAVMGRFGAAYVPGNRVQDTAVCLAGDVVGKDGLCYPKSKLANRDRMWPKGRAPLLTGGEMAAISKAARAAGKLTRTTKRLQKIGLMKKPSRRAVHHRPAMRQIAPGPSIINVE